MVHGVGTDLNQIDHGQVQASDVVAGRSKLPPRVPSLTWPWASKLEVATSQMRSQEVLHPVRHRGQSAVGDQFDIRGRGLGKLWGALRSEITALNHMFSDFGWLPEGCFPHHRLVGAQPLHQRVWRIL